MNTPEICAYLSQADSIMAAIISRYPDFVIRVTPNQNLFESLCDAIISQQLSGKAAAAISKKFIALFDDIFPTPEILLEKSEETLRTAGLSGQKARYLQHIAQFWVARQLHQFDFAALSNDEILQLLTQIKGVGKWTVEMILMFTLYRPDVFSIGDLGIRKSIALHYGLDMNDKAFIAQATQIAEKWQPYRTIACRYLWLALDNR